ncbi:hypothetical protein [Streptomyces sp. NPDC058572]|uniref:hypothetical protein n=1 Tax=Streptomyces sp. NPDC058572 TaxID=3346546 RepID=UPI003667CC93
MTAEGVVPSRGMEEYIADLGKIRPELVELAECLSLAAGVERAFLRRARLRFLPRSTAGLEAELWFSPLVEAAGEKTLLLDPEAAAVLRRMLARRPSRHVEEVRDFTAEAHRDAPPMTRWFEELLWADLFPSPATRREVVRHLERALDAVTSTGDAADDLGRWALHYLPRLPAGVQRHDAAWRIQVASSERLGLEPPHDPFGRPATSTAEARGLVQRDVPVGVSARSDGLVLSFPPADGSRTVRAVGVRKVRLAAASALTPAPTAPPVRLELHRNQQIHLPFTVVQSLGDDGVPTLSVSHAGAAVVAVAAGVPAVADGRRTRYGMLLEDGTIVLHAVDGTEVLRIPAAPDGAPRSSLTLSADGAHVAWVEQGKVGQYRLAPGETSGISRPEGAEACRVHFPVEAGAGLVQAYASGSALLVRRSDTSRSEGGTFTNEQATTARALWWTPGGRHLALLDGSGDLWLHGGAPHEDHGESGRLLARDVTAVTGSPDGLLLVWALADGSVQYASATAAGVVAPVGSAPWQVTGLAVSGDGRQVAAAGGDARLLLWPIGPAAHPPREVRLTYPAYGVFALGTGEWAVSGTGGPVELSTEDGRRYVITPDVEAPAATDGAPEWIRGCVLALAPQPTTGTGLRELAAGMEATARSGVRCLVVGPFRPSADGGTLEAVVPDSGEATAALADLIGVAHRYGVHIVMELNMDRDPDVTAAGVLDSVRRWLDRDLDGVRVAARSVEPGVLDDLRHLLDGYGDRVLVGRSAALAPLAATRAFGDPDEAEAACHVVLTSLDETLGRGIRNRNLGAYDPTSFGPDLTRALSSLRTARPGSQWGYAPAAGLEGAQRQLAAAVLLSLPGCPVLPLSLVEEPAVAVLLQLRRNHLALSRGSGHVLHFVGQPMILGVRRTHGDETIVCLVNAGSETETVTMSLSDLGRRGETGRLLDLLDGTAIDCSTDMSVAIPTAGVRLLRLLPAVRALGREE